jgi:hypothetical protein
VVSKSYHLLSELRSKSEEAHYRLAHVYGQTGEKLQAEKETQLLEQMAKESAGEGTVSDAP